eukprot:scaffold86139_cov59-Phaeocystis_antarctica.AAC.2
MFGAPKGETTRHLGPTATPRGRLKFGRMLACRTQPFPSLRRGRSPPMRLLAHRCRPCRHRLLPLHAHWRPLPLAPPPAAGVHPPAAPSTPPRPTETFPTTPGRLRRSCTPPPPHAV